MILSNNTYIHGLPNLIIIIVIFAASLLEVVELCLMPVQQFLPSRRNSWCLIMRPPFFVLLRREVLLKDLQDLKNKRKQYRSAAEELQIKCIF